MINASHGFLLLVVFSQAKVAFLVIRQKGGLENGVLLVVHPSSAVLVAADASFTSRLCSCLA